MESSTKNYAKGEFFVPLLTNLNIVIDQHQNNNNNNDITNVLLSYFKIVSSGFLNMSKTEQLEIVSNTARIIKEDNSNKAETVFALLCALNHFSVDELKTAGAMSWNRPLLDLLSGNGDKENYLDQVTALTISLLLNKIGGI